MTLASFRIDCIQAAERISGLREWHDDVLAVGRPRHIELRFIQGA